MTDTRLPIIGITMGDAAGIGPELILKIFAAGTLHSFCRPVVIGSKAVFELYRKRLGIDVELVDIDPVDIELSDIEPIGGAGKMTILDLGLVDTDALEIGVVAPEPGNAAVVYTQEAGRLALANRIEAMVSAPLNKEAMRAAGYTFEGQTQILAELCGARRHGMILLLGELRVMMLSTHLSLRAACDLVTSDRVQSMIELADEALKIFGIAAPRIAVAALNPHAGEGGLFGTEEVEGIVPAVDLARKQGIDATGPIPADVVFGQARDGAYDLVLAMYHDQANMAAKLLGFGEVVTILAGLPIVRTSVGHGTAFDIAGKGVAGERNLFMAIEHAAGIARARSAKAGELE